MRQSCNNQPPPCPLCLRGGGSGRVFSEQARLAFGEQLASVHLACVDEPSLYDRLRALRQDPLDWPRLLREGVDLNTVEELHE